jgi:ketosteroid isomerase-like protein
MKMGILIFLGINLMLISACQLGVNQEVERQKIKAILDSYITSIETENIDLYSKIIAHDREMVNFGTSEPPIVGWDSLKKIIEDQNAALSQTKITASELAIHISRDGNFAWATDLWDFKAMIGDQAIEIPVRCSWILEKRDGQWVIAHFHKSVRGAA